MTSAGAAAIGNRLAIKVARTRMKIRTTIKKKKKRDSSKRRRGGGRCSTKGSLNSLLA
jgi:hypothetical protein